MLTHLIIAVGLVLLTVILHAAFTAALISWLRTPLGRRWATGRTALRVAVLGVAVAGLTVLSFVEATLWAAVYVWLGAMTSLHEAIYFSLVTFTTLGYGDVTLSESWRLLGALESTNGIIIFGWSTALVVTLLQRILIADSSDDATS